MSIEAQHPEIEDLAAFVDGLLPPAEHTAIEVHLADCEICYEIVSETLHLTDNLAVEEPWEASAPAAGEPAAGVSVIRRPANENRPRRSTRSDTAPALLPPRRPVWQWPAVAAAAALVAIFLWHPWASPRLPSSAFSVALTHSEESFSASLSGDWSSGVLPQNRGLDVLPRNRGIDELHTAYYRVGVRLVQLELALRAGQPTTAAELAGRIANELEQAGEIGLPEEFRDLGESIAASLLAPDEPGAENGDAVEAAVEELSARARRQAALLASIAGPVESRHFLLGEWVEATRLAAWLGLDDYFARRHPRRDLRRLLTAEFQAEIHQELEAIERELDGTADRERIVASCRAIHGRVGRLMIGVAR